MSLSEFFFLVFVLFCFVCLFGLGLRFWYHKKALFKLQFANFSAKMNTVWTKFVENLANCSHFIGLNKGTEQNQAYTVNFSNWRRNTHGLTFNWNMNLYTSWIFIVGQTKIRTPYKTFRDNDTFWHIRAPSGKYGV